MATSTDRAADRTIETERLVLRPHELADFDDCAAMWADPVVNRFIGGEPADRTLSWNRLLRYVGHWALLGYGYWAVREKASGRFVGDVGFCDFKRPIDPPLVNPEAGWVLASWCHGQGYGREAVGAMIDWADAFLASERTVCIIDPEHVVSLRVADRFGYRETRRATFLGHDLVVLERPR